MKCYARAPVRIDPAGGGTDAPPFSTDHGGWVVNMGVNRHAFASAERLPEGSGVIIYAADLGDGVVAKSAETLPDGKHLEFLKAFIRRLVPKTDSLILTTGSDVPPGSGLGGSGALGVVVVRAIDRVYGRERDAAETAAIANDIERTDLGYPGGSQDSYGGALGGINLLEHRKDGRTLPQRVNVKTETRLALEHASLLIYTGAAHVSGSIHEDIKNSYSDDNSPTVQAMFKLKEQALAMATALESDDLLGYVAALNASCDALYQLHPSCDSKDHQNICAELEELIIGRKTCGAGGGGFLLVHTRAGRRHDAIARAEKIGAIVWPLTLDFEGVIDWHAPASSAEEVQRIRETIARQGD